MRAWLGMLVGVVFGAVAAALVTVGVLAFGAASPFADQGLAGDTAGFLASWALVSSGLVFAGFPFIIIALVLLWVACWFMPPSRLTVTLWSTVLSVLLLGILFPTVGGSGADLVTVVSAAVGGYRIRAAGMALGIPRGTIAGHGAIGALGRGLFRFFQQKFDQRG